MELEILLKAAQEKLQEVNFEGQRSKVIQLTAACELFARHVTRTALDIGDFEMCKQRLIERGQRFATKADVSRTVIAENMHKFSKVPSIVMLHSKCAERWLALPKAACGSRYCSCMSKAQCVWRAAERL
jgi:translation initiation factor eIF-2B subunit alpha